MFVNDSSKNLVYADCEGQNILQAIDLEEGGYKFEVEIMTGENHGVNDIIGFHFEVFVKNPKWAWFQILFRYIMIGYS